MRNLVNEVYETDMDHVKRNALLQSKFFEMRGMKNLINLDVSFSRHLLTQKKAEMHDFESRQKKVQWLNRWDQFRKDKSIFVERALEILKQKRRVINLLALICLNNAIKSLNNKFDKSKSQRKK